MRAHITNVNGISHESAASIAQYNTLKIAREMGIDEIGIYKMKTEWDTPTELSKRLDGVIASIWHDDVIILQLPTWGDLAYEERLVSKIRSYSNTKIIMFIHDIPPIQFGYYEEILNNHIRLYNMADVVILPSKHMHERLLQYGFSVDKVVYQELWDYPMSHMIETHEFNRTLAFTGDVYRFPFIKDWKKQTQLKLYGGTEFDISELNVEWHGYRVHYQLLSDLANDGFGLVWAEGNEYEYYKLNQPFKIATYLAAGIPVIVRTETNVADYVRKHSVGFVISSLNEVDDIVQNISPEEYRELLGNVRKKQYLITNGYYTRALLNEAIIKALE